jgi:hypothetical protein
VESFLENEHFATLNAPDASSLTLRVLSEFGILGFSGMMIFLYHFHVGGMGYRAAISNALLVDFFVKLLRGPLYFEPEVFFFIFIYMLNHRTHKAEVGSVNIRKRRLQSPVNLPIALGPER